MISRTFEVVRREDPVDSWRVGSGITLDGGRVLVQLDGWQSWDEGEGLWIQRGEDPPPDLAAFFRSYIAAEILSDPAAFAGIEAAIREAEAERAAWDDADFHTSTPGVPE